MNHDMLAGQSERYMHKYYIYIMTTQYRTVDKHMHSDHTVLDSKLLIAVTAESVHGCRLVCKGGAGKLSQLQVCCCPKTEEQSN